jgi:hypothetical protein
MNDRKPSSVFAGIRFGEVIEETIREAVALGDDSIEWDFSPILIPPHGGGPPMVAYLLIISCRSLLLTAPRVACCDIIKDSCPDNGALRRSAADTLQAMYAARAELARSPGSSGVN